MNVSEEFQSAETDEAFRRRIQMKAGRQTVNQPRIEADTGLQLDEVGSFYGLTRGDLQNVQPLPPTAAQRAEAYREECRPLLEELAQIIQRARADGLIIGFNVAPDQYGRMKVGEISVTKPL